MKLRSLLLLAGGIAIGYRLSQRLHEDDPDVIHAPPSAARRSPRLQVVSDGSQRISDRATVLSLGAIRRTRAAIQARLAADADDTAWN